jgi:sugar lactone lactonase YvrE
MALVGCGDEDSPAQPTGQVPLAPANLECTAVTATSIEMTWEDESYNEDGFKIYRSASSSEKGTLVGTVAAGVVEHEDTGLAIDTDYHYRVYAYNARGESESFATAMIRTPIPPQAPSNLQIAARTVSSISLTWQDNSTNEQSFKVYRSTAEGVQGDLVATLPAGTTALVDADLAEDTQYSYRVHAHNVAGSSMAFAAASASTHPLLNSISTWAGDGRDGYDGDGRTLLQSSLFWPIDMLWTADGEAYILDWNNHRVRHLMGNGRLETVVGDFVGDGPPDQTDLTVGAPGTTVSLNHPTDLAEMSDGRLLITAWHNHKLRTFDRTTGLVHVLIGRGPGFKDNVPVAEGLMNQPSATVIAPDGTMYMLDQRNQRIRKLEPDGNITTVVGATVLDPDPTVMEPGGFSGDGGPPIEAEMRQPTGSNPQPGGGLALDAQGRLYFADVLNNRVRRADFQANVIETVAGNGTPAYAGDGGPATSASLRNPRDVEIGPDGNLYIADELNNVVRKVDLTTGIITTVAGDGNAGFAGDGTPATSARLDRPTGLAFDAAGDLYICDAKNSRIRRVDL